MTIQFVKKEASPDPQVRPHIEYTVIDGYYDATIYIDHIPVAYFDSSTGGINLLSLEVGARFNGGGEIKDVEYLESKGFQLDKNPHRWGHEDTWEYTIKVGK